MDSAVMSDDHESSAKQSSVKPNNIILIWLLVILFLPFLMLTTVLSFGAPYWHYCLYQRHLAAGHDQEPIESVWRGVLQQAQRQWRIYHALSVIVIPTTVHNLVTPATEKCSWTYCLAAVTLLSGMMNLVFTTIFKEYAETLQQTSMAKRWLEARSSPEHPPGKMIILWVFLSIPGSWFYCSVVATVLSMVFSTWSDIAPGVAGDSCSTGHLYFYHTAIVIVALKALTDVPFMIFILQAIPEYNTV